MDPDHRLPSHGFNGAWGVLSLGLFADGTYGDGWNGVSGTVRGLFYGDASQFAAQAIGTITNIVWVFVTAYGTMKIIGFAIGNRVSAEVELQGLDMPEMGIPAYPDYVTVDSSGPLGATSGYATALPKLSVAKETAQ